FDNDSHLLLIEVAQRQRGQWGGYVDLRLIQTSDEVAQKIDKGEQKTYIEQDCLRVLSSGEGNFNATGPRSAYGKSTDRLTQSFDKLKDKRGMEDGFMQDRYSEQNWMELKAKRENSLITEALKEWSPGLDRS